MRHLPTLFVFTAPPIAREDAATRPVFSMQGKCKSSATEGGFAAPLRLAALARRWKPFFALCGFSVLGATALKGDAPSLTVSDITTSGANLYWDYTGEDDVRVDYLVVRGLLTPSPSQMPTGTFAFGAPQYSDLWGQDGELWDPAGRLPDVTNVGFMSGNEPIPEWPIGENVLLHGAVGDGIHDDTLAIQAAIDACDPERAVFLPNGTYLITNPIYLAKDYIVIRGESRDGTILKFNHGLRDATAAPAVDYSTSGAFLSINGNINPTSMTGTSTHRGLENLTFDFPALRSEGHFSDYGANAISLANVKNSWIRNILINNPDNGITTSGSLWSSILNIEFDNFPGRVSNKGGDGGYVGHNGVKAMGRYNLIHNVNFRGPDEYEHPIAFNNLAQNSVFSRIRGTDLQLDDHGGEVEQNFFTEVNLGEGTGEDGRPTYRGNHRRSVFWNVAATANQSYSNVDPTGTSVAVGVRTAQPSDTSSASYWRESLTPELLHPQNIYLAQMATKLGKQVIDQQFGYGGMTAKESSVELRRLVGNSVYQVYIRTSSPGEAEGPWTPATSFITSGTEPVTLPAAPSGFVAVPKVQIIALDWANNPESNIVGYLVYRSEVEGDFSNAVITQVGGSSYLDRAVLENTTYYYAVTAFDSAGFESPMSPTIVAEALPKLASDLEAVANASFVPWGGVDESQAMIVRNASGTSNDRYVYLRFPIDALNDTVNGVSLAAIKSVALKFTVTAAAGSDLAIVGLNDLADADDINLDGDPIADTYLSETTWTAENLTGTNRPDGQRDVANDLASSQLGGLPRDLHYSWVLPETVTIPLSLANFRGFVANSSNDEITLIVTGPRNGNLTIASLTNTSGHIRPTLEILGISGDSDNDGMVDTWEELSFGGIEVSDGTLDSDGDGVKDFFEFLYGSDPLDALDSGFVFTARPGADGSGLFAGWTVEETRILGLNYLVQVSTDLSTWNPLPVNHYSLSESNREGKTDIELNLTHDYGPQVFLRLARP
jgi:hypothetical protein